MSEKPGSEKTERVAFLSVVTSNREQRKPVARVRGSQAPMLSFRKQSPLEPEDARITGCTRSLYRRLLALNLRKPLAPQPETDAYLPPLTA